MENILVTKEEVRELIEEVKTRHFGDKYKIVTHGCQMNEHDSEKIAWLLEEMGYVETEDEAAADIILINTCSVRHTAEDKVYGHVGQLKHAKKANPNLKIGVCGCMMQRKPSRDKMMETFPHVDIIFGTNNIWQLPKLIIDSDNEENLALNIQHGYSSLDDQMNAKHTDPESAYVNIMYGCNNFCTYCIVPFTRGREVSRKPEAIISEIKTLANKGTKEIILLGQNVNSYGNTLEEEIDFPDLLRKIHEIEGIERIQFMTSHPKDISDKLINCYKDLHKLGNYLHLPVQSGSNKILKAMNRHYTREDYFEIIDKLNKVNPKVALSTDIMVGFPGETEEDFQDTLDLVKRVRYDNAFTFLYSIREGTKAARMKDQVPHEVKQDRFERLLDTVYSIQRQKNEALIGTIQEVLVEGPSKNNPEKLTGRSSGFKLVHFSGSEDLIGKMVSVKITDANSFALKGVVID